MKKYFKIAAIAVAVVLASAAVKKMKRSKQKLLSMEGAEEDYSS